jgi:hypothetical protein
VTIAVDADESADAQRPRRPMSKSKPGPAAALTTAGQLCPLFGCVRRRYPGGREAQPATAVRRAQAPSTELRAGPTASAAANRPVGYRRNGSDSSGEGAPSGNGTLAIADPHRSVWPPGHRCVGGPLPGPRTVVAPRMVRRARPAVAWWELCTVRCWHTSDSRPPSNASCGGSRCRRAGAVATRPLVTPAGSQGIWRRRASWRGGQGV